MQVYQPLVEVERFELPISGSQNQRRRPNWATPRLGDCK